MLSHFATAYDVGLLPVVARNNAITDIIFRSAGTINLVIQLLSVILPFYERYKIAYIADNLTMCNYNTFLTSLVNAICRLFNYFSCYKIINRLSSDFD